MALAKQGSTESCLDCSYRSLRTFCNLGKEALSHLDEIGVHVTLPRRVTAFSEGQPSKTIYIVCAGQLKLSTTSSEGRTMILRLAGPGDVLGLSAALNDLPYEVTAETLEPTSLKRVRRTDFLDFLRTHSEVGLNAAHTLAKEHHEVFLDTRRLALSGSASGRLARLLLDWGAAAAGGKSELRFTMALTHEELADMAGTARETVSRLLKQFECNGLISRHGVSVVILDAGRLNRLAG